MVGVVLSSFDGVPVAYEVFGSGSLTLVFVHGLVGDSGDFESQVSYFAERYRTLAIDLPGAGDSGANRKHWTMESFGEDVATVVEHLGFDRVVLVGHSLGGNVVIEAALRLGDRVKGLVLVSSFRSLEFAQSEIELGRWLAPFDVDFSAAMDDLNRRNFGPDADEILVNRVTERARLADKSRTIGLLTSKFRHQDSVTVAIPNIACPIFAINSDRKPNDTASFAAYGVDLRVIRGVGHFVMLEDPDSFNSELDDIVQQLT